MDQDRTAYLLPSRAARIHLSREKDLGHTCGPEDLAKQFRMSLRLVMRRLDSLLPTLVQAGGK